MQRLGGNGILSAGTSMDCGDFAFKIGRIMYPEAILKINENKV